MYRRNAVGTLRTAAGGIVHFVASVDVLESIEPLEKTVHDFVVENGSALLAGCKEHHQLRHFRILFVKLQQTNRKQRMGMEVVFIVQC